MGKHQRLPKRQFFVVVEHVFEMVQVIFVDRFQSNK